MDLQADFQRVFEAGPGLFLLLSPDLHIVAASDAYLSAMRTTREAILGRHVFDVRPPSAGDTAMSSPILGANGEVAYLLHRVEDQTGVEQSSPAAARSLPGPGESRHREGQLQKQKLEAVGQLAGGLAHDFNNLLTVIASNVAFAFSEVEPDSPIREFLFEIDAAASRAAEVTRQLLAFSRRQVISPKVLDVNEILRGMDRMLRRLVGEDVRCQFQLDADLGRVRADHAQIEQMVMNLAANARDAMPSGGTFVLETANVELDGEYVRTHPNVEPGRYVMLAARDSGVGMSRETLEHVFEPFFSTKGAGHGTGLGLAMVWGIVKQHGGAVWPYSEVGQGSTFKIYLPRVDAPAEAIEPDPPKQWGGVRGGTETILLLDDDAGIRAAVIRLLRRSGYQVLEAPSGDDAVEMARRHAGPLHLLITDVVMPDTSGPQVATELLALRPDIKVLYVSGYTANIMSQHGHDEAEVAFLEKPFAPVALLAKVRQLLDS